MFFEVVARTKTNSRILRGDNFFSNIQASFIAADGTKIVGKVGALLMLIILHYI